MRAITATAPFGYCPAGDSTSVDVTRDGGEGVRVVIVHLAIPGTFGCHVGTFTEVSPSGPGSPIATSATGRQLPVSAAMISMESLILAQDERWRRA